ncbi:MAG: outer membrane protein OmpA [Flaviaesturariibacter sp.]|nr:outer membrane protein OmpA [Flaviaesturariibacter sp.]
MSYTSTTKNIFPGLLAGLLMTGAVATAQTPQPAQTAARVQPVWWFGQSAAANFNNFRGTTQVLNGSVKAPTAFHEGNGVKPYFSLLTEYRPNKVWGGMLNLAFDNRGGKFDGVMAPCNCPADLSTNLSYIAIEPSVRVAPFASAFYLFAGPTLGVNLSRSFTYNQEKQPERRGDWSELRKTVLGAQAGAGIDIPLSKASSLTQATLSPFASFQTDLGQSPRKIESWSLYTIRAGVALKFGTSRKSTPVTALTETSASPTLPNKDVAFSVRAPKVLPLNRKVKETFPLRNSVFFDKGSSVIPARYVQLSSGQAARFKEEQLQESQPQNLSTGRSARQLAVYHNILNILGDRLRSNPQSTIALSGASDNNPAEGKQMAEAVRQYLVSMYGIDGARITTEGRSKPAIPSEQPGATKELDLLKEGDRRVDIVSTSPELLLQVGGVASPFLRPVQIVALQADPLDSHVIFTTLGATETLKSWAVAITDEQGMVQNYGPYIKDQASVSGKTILGNSTQGNYKILMTGQTKDGYTIKKESSVSLSKMETPQQEGLRYSILFDFDKSKSIDSYEKFLADIVTPLIADNSTVIIHGHTDIIGEEAYNNTLSGERAKGAQQLLQRALNSTGKKGVRFETYGFGEDAGMAPFENNYPEERFYNRTVIIDIVPNK